MFGKIGRIELDLGQLAIGHLFHINQLVTNPVSSFLDDEFVVCGSYSSVSAFSHRIRVCPKQERSLKVPRIITTQWRASASNITTERASMTNYLGLLRCRTSWREAVCLIRSRCRPRAMSSKRLLITSRSLRSLRGCNLDYYQDAYLTNMFELRVRYSEMLAPLLALLQEQLDFHRDALGLLEKAIAPLQEIQQSMVSLRVFGRLIVVFIFLPLTCYPGAPLSNSMDVDYIVKQCCAVIMRDGRDIQGIFRLAG